MKTTVVHAPPVMQEVTPATVTLTMSVTAAQALSALLKVVRVCDLEQYDLSQHLIYELDPKATLRAQNTYGDVAIWLSKRN